MILQPRSVKYLLCLQIPPLALRNFGLAVIVTGVETKTRLVIANVAEVLPGTIVTVEATFATAALELMTLTGAPFAPAGLETYLHTRPGKSIEY